MRRSRLPDNAPRIPGLAALVARSTSWWRPTIPAWGRRGNIRISSAERSARVLDGVRAARNLDAGAGTRFGVYGHSQGGGAALWTAAQAAAYAPELHLVGTVAIAPATELAQILDADLRTRVGKVLGSMATVAWSRLYPGATLAAVYASPAAMRAATRLAQMCVTSATRDTQLAALVGATELTLAGGLRSGALGAAPWSAIVAQNTIVAARVPGPVLLVEGSADTIVPPPVTAAFRTALCAANVRVQYDVLQGIGHINAGMQAVPLLLPWFEDRFSALPAPSNCASAPGTQTTAGPAL